MKYRELISLSVLICILAAAFSVVAIWSDYQSSRAQYILSHGRPSGAVVEAEWLRAEEYARDALFFQPANAEYLALMAEIYHWRSADQDISPPVREQSFQRASDFYRQAIEKRPLWPYTWANLALLNAQWNRPLSLELHRAQELGAWEPLVQLSIHEAGLISWRNLSQGEKSLIFENYINSFTLGYKHTEKFLNISENNGYLASFCFFARQEAIKESVQHLVERRCP